ncbi:prepilin-type N-terminal cleavage/methylation domain-containing protein [Teredinibacter sp. KSP-S5-2]|uniref:prepilin-type N-terminal cleavage/methylation domain-containing protein n=1 Tax=Teredinibacter sp. KSP-S5-2 TaxID=3034506 RepID=UPI002934C9E6|nr:GspH/FimT family pseudopilin [Teredinibacter sp. KSP-S5-2]WNO09908.1 prepilin-type N-terminal cleavage/methylation domain-containing protein [Teredinibacter sp. KSP-S5-2]
MWQRGVTLVELVTVLVLIGAIAAVSFSRLAPTTLFQLQASRDTIVAAFFMAQQRAMAQPNPVRLVTSSNQIDLLIDTDNDGSFADESSFRWGADAYPIDLVPNQALTPAIFDFNRLGYTSARTLTLSQAGESVTISISRTGFVN